jgi:lysophospholipase L1-like esterase
MLLKNIFLGGMIFGVFSFGLVFLYIKNERSLDELPIVHQRSTPNNWASSVKIGIIGDSWVAGRKLDQAIHGAMLTFRIPSEVVSSGHPGAKSRQIFRNLLSEEPEPYSSHKLLMDDNLDYLIVVAGVNDTLGHIGKEFYAHHMLQIIRTIRMRGIYPIVVEVPEYGIVDVSEKSFLSFTKHTIYRFLFDKMKRNVISDYRKALRSVIPSSIKDEIILVSFDPFIQDYYRKKYLYANPSHLNKEGWQQLGAYLAQKIAEKHSE